MQRLGSEPALPHPLLCYLSLSSFILFRRQRCEWQHPRSEAQGAATGQFISTPPPLPTRPPTHPLCVCVSLVSYSSHHNSRAQSREPVSSLSLFMLFRRQRRERQRLRREAQGAGLIPLGGSINDPLGVRVGEASKVTYLSIIVRHTCRSRQIDRKINSTFVHKRSGPVYRRGGPSTTLSGCGWAKRAR